MSLRSCTVTGKENAPPGTKFVVKIGQLDADGNRIGEPHAIVIMIIPQDANGIVTGISGKVYLQYSGGVYRELNGDKIGPSLTKDQIK